MAHVGRPKAELDLPENWESFIIVMYGEGASDVEIKAWIYAQRGSFSNDLWDRWLEEEPLFSETIKAGKIYSEAWWAKEGRINLRNKEFSFTGWYMNMKNRFGWADKQEIEQKTEHSGQINHTIDHTKLSDAALREIASLDKPTESKD